MGQWKQARTYRLDPQHEAMIAEVGAYMNPASNNASFNLRTLLDGTKDFLTGGSMPRWMAEYQRVHCTQCMTKSATAGRVADGVGRLRFGLGAEAATRPPRRIYQRLRKPHFRVSLDGGPGVAVRHLFIREEAASAWRKP